MIFHGFGAQPRVRVKFVSGTERREFLAAYRSRLIQKCSQRDSKIIQFGFQLRNCGVVINHQSFIFAFQIDRLRGRSSSAFGFLNITFYFANNFSRLFRPTRGLNVINIFIVDNFRRIDFKTYIFLF